MPLIRMHSLTAVVGYMVSQRKEKGVALMEQWIASPCLWLRRTALLHQVHIPLSVSVLLQFGLEFVPILSILQYLCGGSD